MNPPTKQTILNYWTMKHTHPIIFMWVCYGEETADKKDDIALMLRISTLLYFNLLSWKTNDIRLEVVDWNNLFV